jgi:hypothetical protein
MSIVTTFTPDLARSVQKRDKPAFVERASLGIRLIALLTFPAAAAMFVLRRPLIGMVLQHGNFDEVDALVTSRALAGFSVGLVGFSVYLFVLRGFYAHGDARTPFVVNLVENVVNVVLAFALVDRYGVLGLGLAFAIAYLVSALWALQVLSYKLRGFPIRETLVAFGKMLAAAAVMAEVTWLVSRAVGGNAGLAALARVTRPASPDSSRTGLHSRCCGYRRSVISAGVLSAETPRPPRIRACSSFSASGGSTSPPRATRASTSARPCDPARTGAVGIAEPAPAAEGAGGERHRQPEAGRDPPERQDDGAREAQRERPSGADDGCRRGEDGNAPRLRSTRPPRRRSRTS